LVVLVVANVDLISQEVHGSLNTNGNTLNDEAVNVVNVSQPGVGFFVWSDVVDSILHKFVDFFSISLNQIESWSDSSIVLLHQIIWGERLVPSIEERNGPVLHHHLHFLDIVFHLFDLSVNNENVGHALLDKWLNVLRVPSQGVETWLEELVHLIYSVLHKWFLNWQEIGKNLVVHVDDNFQISSLGSVKVDFLEKLSSSVWNVDVAELQVLDFSEESGQNRVEVNFDESFFGDVSLLSDEQELVKLVLSVLLNSSLPNDNLGIVVLFEISAERVVEFLDILELFSVLDSLGELRKFLHWLINSLNKTQGPVKGSSNWWHVKRDGSSLILSIDETLTFQEDGADSL